MKSWLKITSLFTTLVSGLASGQGLNLRSDYQPISITETKSLNHNGVHVLYNGIFAHKGPKPGKPVGTVNWAAHEFFVAASAFERKDIKKEETRNQKKIIKVIFSFWTKDGEFELNQIRYKLNVLEDKNSNDVNKAEQKIQNPVQFSVRKL